MFTKVCDIVIGEQTIAVGYGNPGNPNEAVYDQRKKRIVMRRKTLKDNPEIFARVLRHECVHVVVDQIDEKLAEDIEAAMDVSDVAFRKYFAVNSTESK